MALAAGLTVALRASPAAPSPLSTLISALARTSAQNYTFSLDSTTMAAGNKRDSDLASGAFDPGRGLGTEQLTIRSARLTAQAQIRFIGGHLYTWVSPGSGLAKLAKPWDESASAAASAAGMPPGDAYGFVSDQPVGPNELAALLQAAGATARDAGSASGQGWHGTEYTFTAVLGGGQENVSGTVYVDEQGMVRREVTTTAEKPGGGLPTAAVILTTDRDLTFGGFGAPVSVTAPPPSQVTYTSGKPYWGFAF